MHTWIGKLLVATLSKFIYRIEIQKLKYIRLAIETKKMSESFKQYEPPEVFYLIQIRNKNEENVQGKNL